MGKSFLVLFVKKGLLALLTMAQMLANATAQFGDALAVAENDERFSFSELNEAARTAACAFINAGVARGDRIAIWAPNSIAWIVAATGMQMAGAILVPLNTRFKAAEAASILTRIRPVLILTAGDFLNTDYAALLRREFGEGTPLAGLASVREIILLDDVVRAGTTRWSDFLGSSAHESALMDRLREVGADDTGDILFTSGTTGAPKGAMHTQGQNLWMADTWNRCNDLRHTDRQIVVNPFFHSFGYRSGFVAGLMAGMATWPIAIFDPVTVMALIEREKVTVLMGSPTLFLSILDHPRRDEFDLSSLRVAHTGGAKSPAQIIGRLRDELGFKLVLTSFGMTEATAMVTANMPDADMHAIATTVGRPVSGVEVRINTAPSEESGEILVRGPNVMQGYFEDPVATAETIDPDGWLHTGDVGQFDADGNLLVLDRIKDVVIVGGFNAYPAEIEAMLSAHPAIAEIAIVAVPDSRQGEVCGAAIVLRAGHTLSLNELVAWSRERMANYKVPRHLVVLEDIPRTALGKAQKFLLRDYFK